MLLFVCLCQLGSRRHHLRHGEHTTSSTAPTAHGGHGGSTGRTCSVPQSKAVSFLMRTHRGRSPHLDVMIVMSKLQASCFRIFLVHVLMCLQLSHFWVVNKQQCTDSAPNSSSYPKAAQSSPQPSEAIPKQPRAPQSHPKPAQSSPQPSEAIPKQPRAIRSYPKAAQSSPQASEAIPKQPRAFCLKIWLAGQPGYYEFGLNTKYQVPILKRSEPWRRRLRRIEKCLRENKMDTDV